MSRGIVGHNQVVEPVSSTVLVFERDEPYIWESLVSAIYWAQQHPCPTPFRWIPTKLRRINAFGLVDLTADGVRVRVRLRTSRGDYRDDALRTLRFHTAADVLCYNGVGEVLIQDTHFLLMKAHRVTRITMEIMLEERLKKFLSAT